MTPHGIRRKSGGAALGLSCAACFERSVFVSAERGATGWIIRLILSPASVKSPSLRIAHIN